MRVGWLSRLHTCIESAGDVEAGGIEVCRAFLFAGVLAVVGWLTCLAPVAAQDYGAFQRAIAKTDWEEAQREAIALDRVRARGDFFALYTVAARMAHEGRCDEAEAVLSALLAVDPGFVPARELSAVCLASSGQHDAAREQLQLLLAILPEGPQRMLVEQMLAGARSEDGWRVSGYLDFKPSTNTNRQTSATTIGPMVILPQSRGQSGVSVGGGLAVSHDLHDGPGFSLAGVVKLDAAWSSANHVLHPTLTAEMPVTFGNPGSSQLLLTPFVAFGFENDVHRFTRIGARGTGSVEIADGMSFGWGGEVYRASYYQTAWRDGWVLDSTATLSTLIDPQTRLTGSLSAKYEHADDPARRIQDFSAALRIDHMTDAGLILGLQGRIGARLHAQPPPPFFIGPNQSDTYYSVRAEASHRDIVLETVFGGAVRPGVYYEYTRQTSDNVFYDFESHDLGLTMRVAF